MKNTTNTTTPTLAVDPRTAAAAVGVSLETLKRWRLNGTGPAFCRLGSRRVRYRLADLDAWLVANRQQ